MSKWLLWLFLPGLILTACQPGGDELPPILYLGRDENDRNQIYRVTTMKEPRALTSDAAGVYDFAIAPDGKQIVYTVLSNYGDSEIWMLGSNGRNLRKILDCPQAECANLVWSPDNQKIIYEKRILISDGISGAASLWWLDSESGETLPVLEDELAHGSGARFSPDGQWLGYVAPEDDGVYVYHLEDGRFNFFPDEIGMPISWHPDSNQFVVGNLDVAIIHGEEGEAHETHTHDYETAVYLSVADPETGDINLISPSMVVDDGTPAWSPDGEWIAFGRKKPQTASGRQLWLMRPDGSDAHALTDDLLVNYGPPDWSPDGKVLLFQRFELNDPTAVPSIWLLEIATGSMREIAPNGMLPAWQK